MEPWIGLRDWDVTRTIGQPGKLVNRLSGGMSRECLWFQRPQLVNRLHRSHVGWASVVVSSQARSKVLALPHDVIDKARGGGVALGTFVFEFSSNGIGRLAAGAGAEFVIYDAEHTGEGASVRRCWSPGASGSIQPPEGAGAPRRRSR